MKTLLVVLLATAVALSFAAVRKESMVTVVTYTSTATVDGKSIKVRTDPKPDISDLDLRPYARAGATVAVVAALGIAVCLRKRKNA